MRITDIRQMFPSEYMCHADLIDDAGKRRVLRVTIDRVEQREIVGDGGMRGIRSILLFNKKPSGFQPKPLVLNSTNTIAVASMHGTPSAAVDINQAWGGKEIELYVGETKSVKKWKPVYGSKMPCLRVRGRSREVEEMKEELRATVAPTYDDESQESRQPGEEG